MSPNQDNSINDRDEAELEQHENLPPDRASPVDMQVAAQSSWQVPEQLDSVSAASENLDDINSLDESGSTNADILTVESSDDGSNAVQVIDVAQPFFHANEHRKIDSRLHPGWEVVKLFLIPVLILGACVASIAMLGIAQRSGWLQSARNDGESDRVGLTSEETSAATMYMCPMLCVPPTTKPGRCPVCAMELVPVSSGSSRGPSSKIQIDPRSRRVAGIQTVPATMQTLYREVRGVGEITYDESRLKTLSAYIDGRIEELYADYTGMEVKKGDSLALIYSHRSLRGASRIRPHKRIHGD